MMESMPPQRNLQTWIAGVLIGVVLIGAAIAFIANASFLSWDFRNNLWSPAHLTVTGRSPYVIEQLFDDSNSVWLPMIIGAFAPLGWLPLQQATNLWAVVNLCLYVGVVWLATGEARPKPLLLALVCVGVLIFPAFIALMRLGQFGVMAAFLMLMAVSWRKYPIVAALCVVLAAAKPQLIVLPALGFVMALWAAYGRAHVTKFILAGAAWCGVLTLPLWWADVRWIDGFMAALRDNPAWHQPSAFVLLPMHWGALGWVAYAVLLLLALAANGYVWRNLPPKQAMIWSLAINLLVTPYTWSWDFVLLIPLLVQTFFRARRWWLKGMLGLGYGVALYAMIDQRLNSADVSDWRFWWFPWALMAVIGLVVAIQARIGTPQTTTEASSL